MKVPYGEGVATHTGPESCVGAGNCVREALTGGRAGWVLSREIHAPPRARWVLRGAEPGAVMPHAGICAGGYG
jgi:hypothetical protein